VSVAKSDVSVVITFYDRERYIGEAIESALAQTLPPLEIIVVNDCSKESSRRHLDRHSKACKIVDLPVNVGLAAARNAGIHIARGQFIALLDDDDIWLPNKLEVQRSYMDKHPECSIVHSAYWAFFSDNSELLRVLFPVGPLTLAKSLTDEYWVCPSTMLFRTEDVRALGGFDPVFRQCEDRDFIVRFCAAGYTVEGIPEPLIRLRRESHNSLTGNLWRIFRSDLKVCWKHRALYLKAYGVRGVVSYVLEKLYTASRTTRYVDGGVRLLLRFLKVKYRVKNSYEEPVSSRSHAPMSGNAAPANQTVESYPGEHC
jgi:glycosyltransferase involved in cell wall biosynthesis